MWTAGQWARLAMVLHFSAWKEIVDVYMQTSFTSIQLCCKEEDIPIFTLSNNSKVSISYNFSYSIESMDWYSFSLDFLGIFSCEYIKKIHIFSKYSRCKIMFTCDYKINKAKQCSIDYRDHLRKRISLLPSVS